MSRCTGASALAPPSLAAVLLDICRTAQSIALAWLEVCMGHSATPAGGMRMATECFPDSLRRRDHGPIGSPAGANARGRSDVSLAHDLYFCGIPAFWDTRGRSRDVAEVLEGMTTAMVRRGRDDHVASCYASSGLDIGSRRLSTVDTSAVAPPRKALSAHSR